MVTFRYEITEEASGEEIQHFLRFRQGLSRKVIISLKTLPEGILINGQHARTIDLLKAGDVLTITLPEQARPLPPCDIPVPLLYWDRDVAVFNKPAGMPVHQSGGHIFGTLASVYCTLCAKNGEQSTFRAVNRLDKDTTGAVVVARHKVAAGKLWKAVTKRYVAIVKGVPEPPFGTIDLPLEQEVPLELKRIVSPDGEEAITDYRVLAAAQDGSCSLVGFVLHTGKTHQIRVHMSYRGWPLLGDELYDGPTDELHRQALHCAGVAFTHPESGEQLCLSAPLPEDMAHYLQEKGIEWGSVLEAFVEELRTVAPSTVEQITERYRKRRPRCPLERTPEMEDIRLIALDLDGTLLDKDHESLSEANRAALTATAARGIEIVVATGRSVSAVAPPVLALPFIRYFITCNGSAITDREGHVLRQAPLAPPVVEGLLERLTADPRYVVQLCADQRMIVSHRDWERREELHIPSYHLRTFTQGNGLIVDDLCQYAEKPGIHVEKVNLPYLPPEEKESIRAWVQEAYGSKTRMVSTLECNLEINDRIASKGWGLLQICDILHLSPKNCMAFGDADNDIEMLQNAGIGVAMGNAIEPLKAVADYITAPNGEDGVATAIRHFLHLP